MDECEALCDRLSIQVKGELKCIGSIPYLKQKFGQGFNVIMRLKDTKGGAADVVKVKQAFVKEFSPCELKDEHSVLLQYHLSNPRFTWKFLFESMEGMKERFTQIIDDYSISETSLEEIFLSFAKASK